MRRLGKRGFEQAHVQGLLRLGGQQRLLGQGLERRGIKIAGAAPDQARLFQIGQFFVGDDAAFLLYMLGAAWLGFAAPGLHRHALAWRGWRARGNRVAASRELAQLEALQ